MKKALELDWFLWLLTDPVLGLDSPLGEPRIHIRSASSGSGNYFRQGYGSRGTCSRRSRSTTLEKKASLTNLELFKWKGFLLVFLFSRVLHNECIISIRLDFIRAASKEMYCFLVHKFIWNRFSTVGLNIRWIFQENCTFGQQIQQIRVIFFFKKKKKTNKK